MQRNNRNRDYRNYDDDYDTHSVRRMKTPSRLEMCVENAAVKTGLGFLGAGLASFIMFRTRGARFTFAGFGAGLGAGMAWMDSKLAFSNPHLDVPAFTLLNMGYVKHQWNRLEDMASRAYNQVDMQDGDFSKRVHRLEKTLKEQAYAAKEKAGELKQRYWDDDETGYAEVIKDKATELKDQAVQKASELKHRYWDENDDAQDMVNKAKGTAHRAKREIESHGSRWKQRNFDDHDDEYHEFSNNQGRGMRDRRSGGSYRNQRREEPEYDDHDDMDNYVDQVRDKAVAMKNQAMGKAYEAKRKYADSDYTDKAKDMANEMKYKTKGAASDMKKKVNQSSNNGNYNHNQNQSTTSTDDMIETGKDMVEKGKQKVKEAASVVKDKANELMSDAKQSLDDNMSDNTKDKNSSMASGASNKMNSTKAKKDEPKAAY